MTKKRKVSISNTALFFVLLLIIVISLFTLWFYAASQPSPSTPVPADSPQAYGQVSLQILPHPETALPSPRGESK